MKEIVMILLNSLAKGYQMINSFRLVDFVIQQPTLICLVEPIVVSKSSTIGLEEVTVREIERCPVVNLFHPAYIFSTYIFST